MFKTDELDTVDSWRLRGKSAAGKEEWPSRMLCRGGGAAGVFADLSHFNVGSFW